MSEIGSQFLDILALLGGGRGSPLNNITPHLLGVIFWASLNLYLGLTRKGPRSNTDRMLMASFIVLFFAELSQLSSTLIQANNWALSPRLNAIWLPAEKAICLAGGLLLAAAFLQFLLRRHRLTINYLIVSAGVVVLMFLGNAIPMWLSLAGQPDTAASLLSSPMLSSAPELAVIAMYLFAIIKMTSSMRQIRWPIIIALTCLLLVSILNLIASHSADSILPVLNPIKGNLQLWTIPFIAYVALRVRQVEGKRLEHGRQDTERLEALGQLSSGIAHDFNNHLQIILGYTELAKSSATIDHKLQAPLDRIEEAATSAGAMVNQLLAFSRGQPPKFIPVDLNSIVTRLTPMLSRLLGAETKVVHDLDKQARQILADEHMIEQIIVNLVVNARDAVAHGGMISIETRSLSVHDQDQHTGEAGYERMQLLVSDTGVGMDEKTLRRAFEPFFTTKPIGKGTGLGLSTVYSAVQRHNGRVFVKSEPGLYTRVYVEFPVAAKKSTKKSAKKSAKKIKTQLKPTLPSQPMVTRGETILLAEDEAAIRDLARNVLQHAGYNVLVAKDGQHALYTIRSYKARIDLCIFDVMMPVINGYDTYDSIAADNPNMPVLFITGNTSRVAHVRNHLPHLQKPFSNTSLISHIRQILEQPTTA